MISVFIVDDHEIVRRGLTDLFTQAGDITVLGDAGTAAEAIAKIPSLNPDVAVLDVRLPDGTGIDVARELRAVMPELKTLMLTSYDDDEAVYAAVMAGANGYLLKEIVGSRLVDSVRAVAAGQSLLDPAVTERVLARLRQPEQLDPRLERLTERESEVLELIGQGLTNRQIAKRLFLAEKTVKNYVSSILDKLDLEHRTQAALFDRKNRDG